MRKETRQGELDKERRQIGWGGPRTRRQTWFRMPRANSLLTGCKMNSGSNHSSNSLAFAWYGLCIVRTCSPICPNATTTISEKCCDGSNHRHHGSNHRVPKAQHPGQTQRFQAPHRECSVAFHIQSVAAPPAALDRLRMQGQQDGRAEWNSELNQQRSLLTEELVRLCFVERNWYLEVPTKKVARARAVRGYGGPEKVG